MAPINRPTLKRCAVPAGLFLAGAVLLSGCTGTATHNESAARQDLGDVQSRYRPHDAKPPLPTLTANSGLPDLLQYALLNNPRVESTFYDWAAAVEEITTARSLPDPMLNFSAEISSGVPRLSAGLISDPGQNWPGPGKLPLKADAAYAEAMKRRAIFENELLGTALLVKRAYYQLWVAQEQIRWTREVQPLINEIEAAARQRFVVGKATQQDVLRAQMEQDRIANQLAGLEDSLKTVTVRLRSALGLAPDARLPTPVPRLDPAAVDFTEESLIAEAFKRNPRLKEMQSEVLQAVALYQLARKSTVPDYSWGVGVSAGAGMPVSVSPSFGITLPIWRDKIAAEIARGQGSLGAAQSRLDAEQLDLAVRFAETAYAWREAERQIDLHGRRLLPKAKAAFDAARAGYSSGATSFIDLQAAEREYLEHHLIHAEGLGQREMALAEMSLVILGRWPQDVPGLLPEPAAATVPEKNEPAHKK